MPKKLSFQDLQDTCEALGAFSFARLQELPDKDLILTIKKINGREVLQTTRLSKMSWNARLVRSFGFGGSTLKAVAHFLEDHEPFLASDLKSQRCLSCYYTKDSIVAINNVIANEKEKFKNLKRQKIQGCEVFKNCVSNHNRHHSKKVYLSLKEYEKEDLRNSYGILKIKGVSCSWPNPMGILHRESEEAFRERYKAPVIDRNEFLYLHPFLRKDIDNIDNDTSSIFGTFNGISPKILGFCYEYGLGTKKNVELAIYNYRIAAENHEYSACYNLACLFLNSENIQDAIDELKKAEDILLTNIVNTLKHIEKTQLPPSNPQKNKNKKNKRKETVRELSKIINEADSFIIKKALKAWNKDLRKVYLAFIETYVRTGDYLLREEYEKKEADLLLN